ncbi:MAG: hypothetical protein KKG75_04910 [Nanoarchaeota archaeon]|nr:hypothetical protein [Nanoarchaeota archaeon]
MNKRVIWLFLFLIVIGLLISYFIFWKSTNCEAVGCFEKAAAECKRAKIWTMEEGGTETYYKIKGKSGDNCELYVKILKVGAETSAETTTSFEGTDMNCKIPLNKFSRMKFEEMGGDLDYCHGTLKEEMYGVLVKKLYKLVLDDMGLVLEEVERVIG